MNSSRPIYETGAVIDALVATGTPDKTARTGRANVIGRTYQEIVQDMVDMYAWGQEDSDGRITSEDGDIPGTVSATTPPPSGGRLA